jgi:hypothetical protein
MAMDEGKSRISSQFVSDRPRTLVERHTRYVTLAKVINKDTQTVVSALIKQAKTLPNELYNYHFPLIRTGMPNRATRWK